MCTDATVAKIHQLSVKVIIEVYNTHTYIHRNRHIHAYLHMYMQWIGTRHGIPPVSSVISAGMSLARKYSNSYIVATYVRGKTPKSQSIFLNINVWVNNIDVITINAVKTEELFFQLKLINRNVTSMEKMQFLGTAFRGVWVEEYFRFLIFRESLYNRRRGQFGCQYKQYLGNYCVYKSVMRCQSCAPTINVFIVQLTFSLKNFIFGFP